MKKTTKQLIVLMLILGVGCILEGCGKESNHSVTITLIHAWGGTEEDHVAMREIYEEFQEENPDINLQMISMPTREDMMRKVEDMIMVGNIPDIVSFSGTGKNSTYDFMIENNMALDIYPYMQQDQEFADSVSEVNKQYWSTETGELYSVADALMLSGGYWYNEDILKAAGIENILALRGDIPQESEFPLPNHYQYAYELIEDIKSQGDFCIGAACYPEGHVESEHKKDDIAHLKQKVDCGVDFLTTQMFFDNNILYNFLYRAREKGVTVPVIPGIMPVTNANQVKRILSMSGTNLPERFKAIVDRFGDNPKAMQQAGIAYATDQIIDLFANGINHVHVYSMNKPEVAAAIQANLSEILNK